MCTKTILLTIKLCVFIEFEVTMNLWDGFNLHVILFIAKIDEYKCRGTISPTIQNFKQHL